MDIIKTKLLPKSWTITNLGSIILKIKIGFPSGRHNKEMKGVPHIRPNNISNLGTIDLTVLKYVQTDIYDRLLKNDILFNNTNSPALLGKTTFLKKDTNWAYSNHMTRIRISEELMVSAWISFVLNYYFYKGFFKINATNHVNQSSINTTFLSNKVYIPLPPLNEQKRIVAKIEELFSSLDAGVESLKRLKAQVKKYRQSVLKSAFEGKLTKEWREEQMKDLALTKKSTNTIFEENHSLSSINKSNDNLIEGILFKVPDDWKWTNIGNNATFIGSGVTPKGGKKVYVSEGILFIRSQNVYMSGLKTDDIACITKETHEKMKRTKVQSKDVLLNITGASIGRSTTIPISIKEANVNQHVCIIRSPNISPYFLSYYLNSESGQAQIFQMQSGATREGLNFQQVRTLKIPLPPLPEQHQIVSEIERHFSIADAVEKIIDESLNKAEKLRQSILKKAFEGKLVPQDPDDEPASVLLEKIKAEKAEREAEAVENALKKKALPRKKKTEVK